MGRLCITAALLFLAPIWAWAGDKPTVINTDGQVVEAIWPSGNRAQAFYYLSPTIQPFVDFEMTENLCNASGIGQKFKLQATVAANMVAWRWVEHKDPSKVGQIVSQTFGEQTFLLSNTSLLSNGSSLIDPRLTPNFAPDEVHFEDMTWIPGMEDDVAKELTLDSWNAEGMGRNSQTGGMENRIISGEIGQKWIPAGERAWRLEHSVQGAFFESASTSAFFLIGDVVSWTFLRNGQSCQMAFKPNGDAANKAIADLLNDLKLEWTPYIWGQDLLPEVLSDSSFFTTAITYVEE